MFCGGANAAQYGVRPSTRVVDSPCSPFFYYYFFWPAIVWLLLHPETPYTWDIREDDHFNLEYEI